MTAEYEGTIRETMATILAEVRAVNFRLDKINGRLEAHDTLLAAHSIKLALLDQAQMQIQTSDKSMRDKVWEVLKPAMIAIVTAVVILAAKGI